MTTTVTTEQVLAKIERDDRYAVNCLLQLYARQTADEQATETTREHNGVGFNAVDAELLSSFARQAADRRRQREQGDIPAHWTDLSPKQMVLLRRKLARYQRQLTELTNDALAAKTARAGVAEAVEAAGGAAPAGFGWARKCWRCRVALVALGRDGYCKGCAGEAGRELADRVLGPVPPTAHHPAPSSCRLVADGADLRFPSAREVVAQAVADRYAGRELPADELPSYDEEDPFGFERDENGD